MRNLHDADRAAAATRAAALRTIPIYPVSITQPNACHWVPSHKMREIVKRVQGTERWLETGMGKVLGPFEVGDLFRRGR